MGDGLSLLGHRTITMAGVSSDSISSTMIVRPRLGREPVALRPPATARSPRRVRAATAGRLARWHRAGAAPGLGDVVITPPTHLVDHRRWLDLGGRAVELVPLAPGHTDNDLVLHVPGIGGSVDGGAWIVGDVLEQPSPPMYGSGCFLMSWPDTLAGLLAEVEPGEVIVPGHGQPVSRAFGLAQLTELATVADRIKYHHAAKEGVEEPPRRSSIGRLASAACRAADTLVQEAAERSTRRSDWLKRFPHR